MGMDVQARIGTLTSHTFWSTNLKTLSSSSSSSSKFFCSSKDSRENQQNDNNGDKNTTDWDRAWSSFRNQGTKKKKKKKSIFSEFSPNKYVSWNPRRSDYPLSEEIDPIKRTERSNLGFWTSTGFTLAGAVVLVTFLLVYTILAPVK